jgi:hypothetical protein
MLISTLSPDTFCATICETTLPKGTSLADLGRAYVGIGRQPRPRQAGPLPLAARLHPRAHSPRGRPQPAKSLQGEVPPGIAAQLLGIHKGHLHVNVNPTGGRHIPVQQRLRDGPLVARDHGCGAGTFLLGNSLLRGRMLLKRMPKT